MPFHYNRVNTSQLSSPPIRNPLRSTSTLAHSIILSTSSEIQLIIFVPCPLPLLGVRNCRGAASPDIPNSSSAMRWFRPAPWTDPPSSTVLSVEADPRGETARPGSCTATRKMLETAVMIVELDELAKVWRMLSWSPS
jgi:hypothetical protein